ncbi:uncharacterized protein C8R40DRAFT_1174072 [Lentinula edodes]|uniref:uncharacterized protein n=1 Tax=Lentinula edodes TaxID=5353 RepID=UPI001E8D42A1|nr:uncharacterized protein C8R40DRAFT_1174072 [Lentinula edodes]KAH7872005.1 hypothetical protein C8R40DRAFT_1174072 [Lentinula edodes]
MGNWIGGISAFNRTHITSLSLYSYMASSNARIQTDPRSWLEHNKGVGLKAGCLRHCSSLLDWEASGARFSIKIAITTLGQAAVEAQPIPLELLSYPSRRILATSSRAHVRAFDPQQYTQPLFGALEPSRPASPSRNGRTDLTGKTGTGSVPSRPQW